MSATFFSSIRFMLYFFLGASGGSFAQLWVDRGWQQDIVFEPSHCPHCSYRIAVIDLLPIWGYIRQRGRCRYCHLPIDPQSLQAELLGGTGCCWLVFHYNACTPTILWLSAWLFLCSLFDWRHHYVYQEQLNLTALGIVIWQWPLAYDQVIVAILVGLSLWLLKNYFNQGLGSADIQWAMLITLANGLTVLLQTMILANLCILLHVIMAYFGGRKLSWQQKIPFLPYLFVAYLLQIAWPFADYFMSLLTFL